MELKSAIVASYLTGSKVLIVPYGIEITYGGGNATPGGSINCTLWN